MEENRSMYEINAEMQKMIDTFYNQIENYLPEIANQVDAMIEESNQNKLELESMLNILLKIVQKGKASDLYIKLLEFYKTIDPEKAKQYWDDYDGITQ